MPPVLIFIIKRFINASVKNSKYISINRNLCIKTGSVISSIKTDLEYKNQIGVSKKSEIEKLISEQQKLEEENKQLKRDNTKIYKKIIFDNFSFLILN